jgi:hypothetical protein
MLKNKVRKNLFNRCQRNQNIQQAHFQAINLFNNHYEILKTI